LIERCLVAGRAIWFYLSKLAWPVNLIFIYPKWQISAHDPFQYLYPTAAVAFGVGLWTLRRRSRAPFAAFLCFSVVLAPALGFVNVYPFRYSFVADHFQYLAAIPIMAFVAHGVTGSRPASFVRRTAAIALVTALGLMTWQQSRQYADAETL